VETNGAFKATVHISPQASPGEAFIVVNGSAFDHPCQDTFSSCAGYAARLKRAGSTLTSARASR
jgi:hypothetical protein